MGSLLGKLTGGGSREPREGVEHRRMFPLLCQAGNDGNRHLEAGMPAKAQRQYLKVMWYLGGTGLIDQFLLAKAYLGLMAVEARNPRGQLRALVQAPPPGGFTGPMEVVTALYQPARHCFKQPMLSRQDHDLYEALCDFGRGEGAAPPTASMSSWDLRRACQESFPILLVAKKTVVTTLERSAPPELSPDLEGTELQVTVPGLPDD